jgi:hypothetical protein
MLVVLAALADYFEPTACGVTAAGAASARLTERARLVPRRPSV